MEFDEHRASAQSYQMFVEIDSSTVLGILSWAYGVQPLFKEEQKYMQ